MRQVRILLWAALVVAGLAIFALWRIGDQKMAGQTQGDLGSVPAFSLTDQSGQSFGSNDLLGKPWVANFVFTRCPSVCPLLSAKFAKLQGDLNDVPDVQFVSFSVDPENDTPPVLAAYAEKYQAGPRWHFLTGPLDAIEKTVVAGFKIHVGEKKPSEADPSLIEIMHGEHFVLVDGKGGIRGYYRAEPAELAQLGEDLRALSKERLAKN